MTKSTMRGLLMVGAAVVGLGLMAHGAMADTTLTLSSDNNVDTVKAFDALTKAYSAAHPGVKFEIDNRPGGAEGDNLVKTRLSTGEMADIFQYNSGSLFQALKPEKNLADLRKLVVVFVPAEAAQRVSTKQREYVFLSQEEKLSDHIADRC